MAVTLVNTGIQFPDGTIQTTKASGLPNPGTLTTTQGASTSAGTYLGNGGAGWYYFADFSKGVGNLDYVLGWEHTVVNYPYNNMPIRTGSKGGLFYANSTPRINSVYYSYNSGSGYTGGNIKWKKL